MSNLDLEPRSVENRYSGVRGRLRWAHDSVPRPLRWAVIGGALSAGSVALTATQGEPNLLAAAAVGTAVGGFMGVFYPRVREII